MKLTVKSGPAYVVHVKSMRDRVALQAGLHAADTELNTGCCCLIVLLGTGVT